MKLKNILGLMLALVLVLGLFAGCGGQTPETPNHNDEPVGTGDAPVQEGGIP